MQSYIGNTRNIKNSGMTAMEEAGDVNSKDFSVQGISLLDSESLVLSQICIQKIVLTTIGSIRTIIFASSTCVTVHSNKGPAFDESVVLIIAARSRNLWFRLTFIVSNK